MSLQKKKIYVLDYVFNDKCYIENESIHDYSVYTYIDTIEDLFEDQIDIIKNNFFDDEKYYKDSQFIACEINIDLEFKLQEYAKFIVYMHGKICKRKVKSTYEIKILHLSYYNINSQRNYFRYPKKFYLL